LVQKLPINIQGVTKRLLWIQVLSDVTPCQMLQSYWCFERRNNSIFRVK